jgi:hypothetical protein
MFPDPQWASFSKKLQKLIILAPMHIFLFLIQGKGKIARGIRIWTENRFFFSKKDTHTRSLVFFP